MYTQTVTKKYIEHKFEHLTLFGDCPIGETMVFYEYWKLIENNRHETKEKIIELIDNYKPVAKSKLSISKVGNRIEFFAPNKYIFPKFYIKFNS